MENHPTTRNAQFGRWIRRGILVTLVVLVIVFVHGVRRVNPKSIETAISQNLGHESDLPAVRRFMGAHQIEDGGYSPDIRRAYGTVYKSSVGLRTGRILIHFDFDEHGKLASHMVVEVWDFLW